MKKHMVSRFVKKIISVEAEISRTGIYNRRSWGSGKYRAVYALGYLPAVNIKNELVGIQPMPDVDDDDNIVNYDIIYFNAEEKHYLKLAI